MREFRSPDSGSSNLVLRPFQPPDLERILEITLLAWEPMYAHYREVQGEEIFQTLFPDWRSTKKEQVAGECNGRDGAKMIVATIDGIVAGFAAFYLDQDTGVGMLGNNAVHPDFRGLGIGPALYEWAFDRMKELGATVARVQTMDIQPCTPARRAYEKSGFTVHLPSVEYYRRLS